MLHSALKATREFHRLRLTDLADRIGISKSYLSQIENGKKPVTLEIIEKYSQCFDIPASSLMFFAEHIDDTNIQGKFKKMFAGKILKIMEWINSIEDTVHESKI